MGKFRCFRAGGILQTPGGPRPAGAGWSRVARGTPSPVQVPSKLDAHVLVLGRDSLTPSQPACCPLCFCSGPRNSRRDSGVPLQATGEGSRANEAREGDWQPRPRCLSPGELAKGRRRHRCPEARLGRDRARVSIWGLGFRTLSFYSRCQVRVLAACGSVRPRRQRDSARAAGAHSRHSPPGTAGSWAEGLPLCSVWSRFPKLVFRELTFTCRVCKRAGRGTFFAKHVKGDRGPSTFPLGLLRD